MAGYERDFMGRVRGMWDRFAGQRDEGPRQRPMGATGPGGEGYFLSRGMARDSEIDYSDRGWDDGGDRGFPPGGMAQFGRAGAGRGYGGDYRTGRGGYDSGEFFVNRHQGGDTGYQTYQRDLGMQGGRDMGMQRGRDMAAGGWGYGSEYTYGGFARGYNRDYRGGHLDRGPRYGNDYRDMGSGMRSYSGTHRDGGVIGQGRPNNTPFPRPRGR